jgi:hypothetical protein
MTLAVENEDPFELAGVCLGEIIEALRERHSDTAN